VFSPAALSPAALSLAALSLAALSPAALSPAALSPAALSPVALSPVALSLAALSLAALSPAALSLAALSPAALSPAALSPAALSPAALSPAALSPAALLRHPLLRQFVSSHPPPSHLPASNRRLLISFLPSSPPAMDRRRVAASTESWRTVDSGWTSGYELEEIHGVMDGANYHGDHATQDDTHNASEQHHQSPSPSDGVRYRASHAGRHRLTTTTPVVSPRASPPASQRRVSGGPVPTTVHMSRISARQQYLVQLCRAIITFGALTHQLEEYMSMSSLPLEIEGEFNFSYIPDCMTIRFSHGVVELVRASEGIDLGRAQDVHDINMDVAHGRLGVEEAARRLDGVSGARSKYK
ncbi:hypothetical protein E4U22_004373, partial [Claviceps purpurea]